MQKPKIYRKRYIPNEMVDISGDELLLLTDELMITRWKPIRPRNDFSGGTSYTFLKEGYKISRFNAPEGGLKYWYIDVTTADYDPVHDRYTITDLLLDVKIFPDGKVQVLDLAELAEAMEEGAVTLAVAVGALKGLDKVLSLIDSGSFPPAVCTDEQYW